METDGYQLGLDKYNEGDYEAAIREWEPLSKNGDVKCQFHLGLLFKKGQGAPQNYEVAKQLFANAAKHGHIGARFAVGVMLKNGQGEQQDYKKAMKLFANAAEHGHTGAQVALGVMYEKGQVEQDYIDSPMWKSFFAYRCINAHMWGNIAAYNGNKKGRKLRNRVAKSMTTDEISSAQQLAWEWYERKSRTGRG